MTRTTTADSIVEEISIAAPAERIFDALTTPDQLVRWWGDGIRFRATEAEADVRPGGAWSMRGIGRGGRPFIVRCRYVDLERPRVVSFTWLPDWQGDATESLVRFDLVEERGVTRVRITHSGLVSEASRTSHRGWPNILEWLKAYVQPGA